MIVPRDLTQGKGKPRYRSLIRCVRLLRVIRAGQAAAFYSSFGGRNLSLALMARRASTDLMTGKKTRRQIQPGLCAPRACRSLALNLPPVAHAMYRTDADSHGGRMLNRRQDDRKRDARNA
jgi:hypothetical protein